MYRRPPSKGLSLAPNASPLAIPRRSLGVEATYSRPPSDDVLRPSPLSPYAVSLSYRRRPPPPWALRQRIAVRRARLSAPLSRSDRLFGPFLSVLSSLVPCDVPGDA
ncbi:uncharacterized protein SCHCODRAFT_02643592 [Schizophyllum commune H4-8]|uniref:uncharacterized protein n=1 Tax=Schizophyllum commune (strain H4-8 / FGSC 9210) TaxID=578458 RepID=UPI00215F7ED4|nr:uncharacterized protein SCHCODRAFT_02643592 [Schizophyllum commune H4-8]KAI5886237.1 hypothetical protein SCHCODRAFT_02643592 [Schizophyllum commune H4-8]